MIPTDEEIRALAEWAEAPGLDAAETARRGAALVERLDIANLGDEEHGHIMQVLGDAEAKKKAQVNTAAVIASTTPTTAPTPPLSRPRRTFKYSPEFQAELDEMFAEARDWDHERARVEKIKRETDEMIARIGVSTHAKPRR